MLVFMTIIAGFTEDKTFRPKKFFLKGSKRDQLHTLMVKTLGAGGNLREAVRVPAGEKDNEWLAVNTLDFYNQLNLMYGSIRELCTEATCPTMSAGPAYEYYWADEVQKKPVKLTAPQYIDNLMTWVQAQLDNESIFPMEGDDFPSTFKETVKTIFKRLFRIYAHIYYNHYKMLETLQEEKHLNSCYKHFIFFVEEHDLVEKKEMAPLATLSQKLSGGQPVQAP
ncbi:mob1 [Capsaspora owczarzaki ATCC 30864]|uniref:Mob1 n=1 Tax=Capsaspora owczarzaki (strain ATCC 30864) TaxID=595528 RepID=A0A0D2X3V0_CAPO3|nr:mob1 [Capsaspora owczarzaki ATCC 30864]KJE94944.1 mob1 [Capsaspora owczarzaki ATCC 30864]|eukprot:XP_004346154.1 mob1 [Capsaspora owczarzaki ATCC 30864]